MNRHMNISRGFTENEIQEIYEKKVKLPVSYFTKYLEVPPCPLKSWDYQWGNNDCPRIFIVLDFKEWVEKYKIQPEQMACTYEFDPELELISYKNLTVLTYPPHDLHAINFMQQFDFFLFNQTIEHLYNPLFAIQNIFRSLKPGGYVFTSVPTINIPHLTPFHYGGYNPMGLALLFISAGFEILEIGQFGNLRYIEYIFKNQGWGGYDTFNINGQIENEENNVCQSWILARRPNA